MTTISRWSSSLAFAATIIVPTSLAAQRGAVMPRPQLRCAAYDSLMTGMGPGEPGNASVQGVGGTRMIDISRNGALSDQDHGITDVSFTVRADQGVGVGGAAVQVTARLTEPVERPLSERQGILRLDDTLTIDLGSLAQTPGLEFPNGVRTWYLYGPAPRGSLLALARAKQIEFKVGSTRWTLPDLLLQNIRGGLAALVCQR